MKVERAFAFTPASIISEAKVWRAQAETTAARKAREDVGAELGKKDRLLTRFKKQIAVQERQIEDLTAGERGDFNEEQLLFELRSAFAAS